MFGGKGVSVHVRGFGVEEFIALPGFDGRIAALPEVNSTVVTLFALLTSLLDNFFYPTISFARCQKIHQPIDELGFSWQRPIQSIRPTIEYF